MAQAALSTPTAWGLLRNDLDELAVFSAFRGPSGQFWRVCMGVEGANGDLSAPRTNSAGLLPGARTNFSCGAERPPFGRWLIRCYNQT